MEQFILNVMNLIETITVTYPIASFIIFIGISLKISGKVLSGFSKFTHKEKYKNKAYEAGFSAGYSKGQKDAKAAQSKAKHNSAYNKTKHSNSHNKNQKKKLTDTKLYDVIEEKLPVIDALEDVMEFIEDVEPPAHAPKKDVSSVEDETSFMKEMSSLENDVMADLERYEQKENVA